MITKFSIFEKNLEPLKRALASDMLKTKEEREKDSENKLKPDDIKKDFKDKEKVIKTIKNTTDKSIKSKTPDPKKIKQNVDEYKKKTDEFKEDLKTLKSRLQ